jgi:hypothetical protein
MHGRNTGQVTNLHQPIPNLSLYQRRIHNTGIKIYSNLPSFIERASDISNEFKSLLKNFIYSNYFYTLDGYLNYNTTQT